MKLPMILASLVASFSIEDNPPVQRNMFKVTTDYSNLNTTGFFSCKDELPVFKRDLWDSKICSVEMMVLAGKLLLWKNTSDNNKRDIFLPNENFHVL